MTPKLLMFYLKNYLTRDDTSKASRMSRIKAKVYPKYIIRYASKTDRNRVFLYYRIQDVYQQVLEDWGKYDMAIQPFII